MNSGNLITVGLWIHNTRIEWKVIVSIPATEIDSNKRGLKFCYNRSMYTKARHSQNQVVTLSPATNKHLTNIKFYFKKFEFS